MTPIRPDELREALDRAGLTQAQAAARCHVAVRTMRQWLQGRSAMPLAASELLMLSMAWPPGTSTIKPHVSTLRRWLRPEFVEAIISHSL
jgi:DNA-binding transcriptional regulator YiaG